MKKLWIFISAVLVQLLVILSLTVYVNSSASKAVNWKVDGYTLTALSVNGADDSETEKLNGEIKITLTALINTMMKIFCTVIHFALFQTRKMFLLWR